ncbi:MULTISPECIES: cation-translocating P-type ATPase [Methanobacterium]|uniref:Cation-translocating P-type ATPase n=1 Tax=Methanobacterium formicicum TaxID=2162 RepID=A0A843AI78_METFO|nr:MULTISPECIES: cation-translocating P-type ATPase [Methanobacterium]KUK74800.1 MAG: Heavy metal translocating P-type ATPase [Methanobacterium sp. 42_16]MBF4474499.1 cation-translocating P-type ATPase [Methanobacterium formicicum]MDG3547362.1 cation-translocating P-type ATPase [Methanobacterium formicicum]
MPNIDIKNNISFNKFKTDSEYRSIVLTIISAVFLLISWSGILKNVIPFDVALVSVVISGTPILLEAVKGLITSFDLKANVLVSIALIASLLIGEYFAAAEIAVIMMIGEILEDRTVRKARESVKKLLELTPPMARIKTPDGEREIPVEDLAMGDILLVKPGESIPVDGIIIKGHTSIDQSILTGESMPVDKKIGDEVFIGTLNQLGVIEVEATKVGEDTSLAKLIRLVRDSEDKKAPVVRLTDRVATVIVPLAVAASLITYFLTQDIIRLVTILVVFCPCALVLATPTAIMAGIGNASRKGILIKSGEALETVGKVDVIAFDKTGTITYGKPEVAEVMSLSDEYTPEEILSISAMAEKFSEHPIGQAVLHKAENELLSVDDPQKFRVELGQGVEADIDNQQVLVGNRKLMDNNLVLITPEMIDIMKFQENRGKTVLLVAIEQSIIGIITVADRIKGESREIVEELKEIGIKEVFLLTGDNQVTASSIARDIGVDRVYSQQLPEDKVRVIEEQLQQNRKVGMIGDGINDAPALARSNVGVAMGALGSDVAIETADVALMSDDISKIPELIHLSRKVRGTINVNIVVPILINFTAIVLAAFGIIGPVAGALIHNLGSVLVVGNSSRLINYRRNKTSKKSKIIVKNAESVSPP